ncbi:MAG: chitobiase/beta-hexosaminidase C-terminal domain-containing protein, partial [Paludibacteraceae bacterium]|nr:chitobiase/beta-hexosaminidase C-terminal domain-containing protein [Paludibacteraceae bacterium]
MSFDNAEGSTHVPYSLDVDGGYIYLYDPEGAIYTVFEYPFMKPHISYGMYKNESGYMLPTPADSNSKVYGDGQLEDLQCLPPTFGETQPGVFGEQPSEGDKVKRKVTLSCATKDAEIRYTTDGKEPTSTSDLYDPETTKISF